MIFISDLQSCMDSASGFATFRTGVICVSRLPRWRGKGRVSAFKILCHIVGLNLDNVRLVNSMSSCMIIDAAKVSVHLVMDHDLTRHIMIIGLLDLHSVLHCFTRRVSCRIVVFHSMRALIAFTSAAWLVMIMVVYYCMKMIGCLAGGNTALITERVGNRMRVMDNMFVMSVMNMPFNDLGLLIWYRILLELRIWLWLWLGRRRLVYYYYLFVFVVTFLFLLGNYFFLLFFFFLFFLFLFFSRFFLFFAR